MHKAILVLVTALALIAASTAQAASDPRVPALQRQVRSLTAKVGALQQQVNQHADIINREIDLSTCRFVYQSHFNFGVLNLFALLIGNPQIADQTGSDNGACSRVGIAPPRALLSFQRSPFLTLVGWLVAQTR